MLGQLLERADVREQQRTGNVCDHRVAVTLVQRVVVCLEAGHIDALVVDLELGQTGDHQDKTEADADNDRDRQIEHDRARHGDDELRHCALELVLEHIADRAPLVHAPCRDHQHAGERCHRNVRDDRREHEHHDEQADSVEDAGQAGLCARADGNRGTRERSGRRNTAEHRQHHVADALREQLLVVVQLDAGRSACARAAQQALQHIEHSDGKRRCEQSRNRRPVDLRR